jgi:type II secretory pathway predicted ATPase ExeA
VRLLRAAVEIYKGTFRGAEYGNRVSDWIKHFKLDGNPFGRESETWRYYYGARYGVSSLRLEQAFEQKRGYIVVSGPAGTGKSTLVNSVLSRTDVYAKATVSVSQRPPACVIDALLSGREPLQDSFTPTRKRAALLEMIEHARSQNRSIVCVVEDAHLARAGQLKDLITAINITPDAHQVLLLVLVGRADLNDTLRTRSLAGLKSRIATKIETVPMSMEEVADFVADRLDSAGCESPGKIFPHIAMRKVAQGSHGVIALCETIARTALDRAATGQSKTISPELVEEIGAIYRPPSEGSNTRTLLASLPGFLNPGPVLGVVSLALLVAAAQIAMVGSNRVTVEAAVGSLTGISATPTISIKSSNDIAQRRKQNMRENFLAGTPYEVEIAPPARPAPAGQTGMSGDSVPSRSEVDAITISPAPATDAERPITVGPTESLQVGAFRELRSAADMKARLQKHFGDVYISTIESGGEPLYRVRIGRFRTNVDTLHMIQLLQAAGYPSFRVKADS